MSKTEPPGDLDRTAVGLGTLLGTHTSTGRRLSVWHREGKIVVFLEVQEESGEWLAAGDVALTEEEVAVVSVLASTTLLSRS